jgi:uncharacterized protein
MLSFEIITAGDKGRGAFATRALRCGTHIYTIGGRRITLAQSFVSIITRSVRVDDSLQIGYYKFIVPDEVSICFNHSCDANCALVREAELIANRDIEAGEELTFDYSLTVGPSFYSWAWQMKCRCGSSNCRGLIRDLSSVPRRTVDSLFSSGLLQDYIIDYIIEERRQQSSRTNRSTR